MDNWAYECGVKVDFSRPGKPTAKPTIESFNGRRHQERLYELWFMSLDDAKRKIEAWRTHYNESRPYAARAWRMPREFALQHGPEPVLQSNEEAEVLHLCAVRRLVQVSCSLRQVTSGSHWWR